MNPNSADNPAGTGKAEKRTPHSIRFFGPEWERIEAFAEERGLAPAEFVRFATLGAIADGDSDPSGKLAPLIKTTFRSTYIVATRLRGQMLDAGEQEELDTLIKAARDVQKELLVGTSQ